MIKVSLKKDYKFLCTKGSLKPSDEATLENGGNGRYNLVSGLFTQTLKQNEYDAIMADQGGIAKVAIPAKKKEETKPKDEDPRVAELNAVDKAVLLEMANSVDENVKGTWGKAKLIESIIKAEKDEE